MLLSLTGEATCPRCKIEAAQPGPLSQVETKEPRTFDRVGLQEASSGTFSRPAVSNLAETPGLEPGASGPAKGGSMKLRRESLVLFILVLGHSLAAAAPVLAYPISPQPLWKLTGESELVVVAEVQEIRRIPFKEKMNGEEWEGERTVAVLRILESWKGNENGTIEVPYPAGLSCPAPPVYIEGETVLAFLEWAEKGWGGGGATGWSTVGLSYGTLYPSRDELSDFREMVRKAVALQAKGRVPGMALVDWLAEAAARPGTRWHGLYALVPGSDEIRSYYDRSGTKALNRKLTPAHLERIARGFIASPSVDVTLPMALAVLSDYRSKEVDEAAVSAMEGLYGQTRLPYWTLDSLRGVLRRFEGKGTDKRLARLEAIYEKTYEVDEDEVREVWRVARRELSLPKVVPARAPERKVWGVGETTPD